MKIRLHFKTPDVAEDALEDRYLNGEAVSLTEDERYEAEELIKKFVQYSECVTIELCTETCEATVIPVNR